MTAMASNRACGCRADRKAPEVQVCMLDRGTGAYADAVCAAVAGAFGARARPILAVVDLGPAWDAGRGQLEAGAVLKLLDAALPEPEPRTVAITSQDLGTPVLSFVFGAAQPGGRLAVVSLFRLRNSFYGLPEKSDILVRRLEKQAVHELGHTFGLTHCAERACAMHSSTFAEDIDMKSASLCRACARAHTHTPAAAGGASSRKPLRAKR
jgi:archaemetzincin